MLWVRDCALFYVFVLMRMSFALNCDLILSPLALEFASRRLIGLSVLPQALGLNALICCELGNFDSCLLLSPFAEEP